MNPGQAGAGDEAGGTRPAGWSSSWPVLAVVIVVGLIAVAMLIRTWDEQPRRAGAPAGDALPQPRASGPMSLEEVLGSRRSVRSFTTQELTPAEVGQLLWAAQGVTDGEGRRTAPSAGARYPLEVDVVTADGVDRYVPDGHRLARRSTADLRAELQGTALDQPSVGKAPAVIVISGVASRTAERYGAERAERYVAMEAGHAAQNVLLEAVSLGLGAVPVGAFDDAAVRAVLDLADGEAPLYLIPVGHPR